MAGNQILVAPRPPRRGCTCFQVEEEYGVCDHRFTLSWWPGPSTHWQDRISSQNTGISKSWNVLQQQHVTTINYVHQMGVNEEDSSLTMLEYSWLAALAGANLISAMAITSLFPILPEFVLRTGVEDHRDVGYWAGALAAAFMVGRTLSSLPLGMLSDRTGRRFPLLLGTGAVAVLMPAFAMTRSFTVAFSIRLITGLLNAIVATIKAMVSELVPPEK